MAYCSQTFTVQVTGADEPCTIEIDSDDRNKRYDVDEVSDGLNVEIDFTYTVGAPARSVFASSYTKSRSGGSGTTPDLAGRTFSKTPDTSLGAQAEDRATLTVQLPAYGGTPTTELSDGTDTYDVIIYLREATDRIGGDSPPSNLDPANPN